MDLFPLVRAENGDGIRKLLREQPDIDVNVKNEVGQTPLYWACELPKPDIARVLIQAGADLNLTEQHGFTPLHLASWIGNEEMVQLLLEFRADLNRRNNSGSTPVHLAAKNSHVNVLRLLLRQGADRNVKDDKGNMPLDYAKTPEVKTMLSAPVESVVASPVRSARAESAGPSATPGSPAPASPSPATNASSLSTSGRGARTDTGSTPKPNSTSDRQPSSTATTREKIEKLQVTIKNTNDAAVLKKIATVTSDTVLAELHKMDKLHASLASEQKKAACLKCNAAPRDTVLIPCMHLAYCAGCVAGLGASCGVCAAPIDGRLRVDIPK